MSVFLYGEIENKYSGAYFYFNEIKNLVGRDNSFSFSCNFGLNHYDFILFKIIRRLIKNFDPISLYFHNRRLKKYIDSFNNLETIIIIKGARLFESTILHLKNKSNKIYLISHDDFFSNYNINWSINQWSSLKLYDKIFTTRNSNLIELDFLPIQFFPFGYDREVHYSKDLVDIDNTSYDLTFIGAFEHIRKDLIFNFAKKFEKRNVLIAGPGWMKYSNNKPKNVEIKPGLWGDNYRKSILNSKVNIIFLRLANRDDYTVRSFEIPISGGLFVAENTEMHQQLFGQNNKIIFFNPLDQNSFNSSVEYVINNPNEAKRNLDEIRINIKKFNYKNRIKQILNEE